MIGETVAIRVARALFAVGYAVAVAVARGQDGQPGRALSGRVVRERQQQPERAGHLAGGFVQHAVAVIAGLVEAEFEFSKGAREKRGHPRAGGGVDAGTGQVIDERARPFRARRLRGQVIEQRFLAVEQKRLHIEMDRGVRRGEIEVLRSHRQDKHVAAKDAGMAFGRRGPVNVILHHALLGEIRELGDEDIRVRAQRRVTRFRAIVEVVVGDAVKVHIEIHIESGHMWREPFTVRDDGDIQHGVIDGAAGKVIRSDAHVADIRHVFDSLRGCVVSIVAEQFEVVEIADVRQAGAGGDCDGQAFRAQARVEGFRRGGQR